MDQFNTSYLPKLYIPPTNSHKGQNGKLMVIGGSTLFHAASIWSLSIASKIIDMVFYSSIPDNNEIILKIKEEFRNGIVIPRKYLEDYIAEAEAILIGPGMLRTNKRFNELQSFHRIEDIMAISNEGQQTYFLTKYLLQRYDNKKWIIDAGALQMLDLNWLKSLKGKVILTPHPIEFQKVFNLEANPENVKQMSQQHNCIILLKGLEDTICSPIECVSIAGGNAGMTKGGTGDVLAGLIAALATKNELYLAAICGSYINKKAGEKLYQRVGLYYNSSDLVEEIPKTMKQLLLKGHIETTFL